MLERLIGLSIRHRWLTLVLTAALIALGVWSYRHLSIDATPDITNVQVQINTQAPGYSPLEAEQRVTFAIETAMAVTATFELIKGQPLAMPRFSTTGFRTLPTARSSGWAA